MDLSTIFGVIAAFGLMIAAIMTGGSIFLFIDPAAIMIVGAGPWARLWCTTRLKSCFVR